MAKSAAESIGVGSSAPDFTLPSNQGKDISLHSYKGKSVVVLYFYPKDNTAVCTKEACLFRDSYESFAENGATVLGISSDSTSSHESFAKSQKLPFYLLSDTDGAVRKLYQVKSTFGLMPGRVTYVIDKEGVIRHEFDSPLDASGHVAESLAWVKKLSTQ